MNETTDARKLKWDADCQAVTEFRLPFRLEDAFAVIGGNLIRTYTIVKFLERQGKLRRIRTNTYETI